MDKHREVRGGLGQEPRHLEKNEKTMGGRSSSYQVSWLRLLVLSPTEYVWGRGERRQDPTPCS